MLESSSFMPRKHLAILMNLFDVGAVTVQDIMIPRAKIESIKLDDDMNTIVHHLVTSYHQRLPVFKSALGEVVGVLQIKKVLAALPTGTLDKETLQEMLSRTRDRIGRNDPPCQRCAVGEFCGPDGEMCPRFKLWFSRNQPKSRRLSTWRTWRGWLRRNGNLGRCRAP